MPHKNYPHLVTSAATMRQRERESIELLARVDNEVLEAIKRVGGGRPVGARELCKAGVAPMTRISLSLHRLARQHRVIPSIEDKPGGRTVYQLPEDYGPWVSEYPEWMTGLMGRPPYVGRLVRQATLPGELSDD